MKTNTLQILSADLFKHPKQIQLAITGKLTFPY